MAAVTIVSCSPVKYTYRTETDLTGAKVLIGRFPRAALERDSSFQWFAAGYSKYTPDLAPYGLLRARSSDLRFVVFIGTWCSDSKAEVPRMFKVFDTLKIAPDRIELYGVDRMKKSGDGAEASYGVTLVPTLIVYDGTTELGRIVEQPREGIESDISRMLQKAR